LRPARRCGLYHENGCSPQQGLAGGCRYPPSPAERARQPAKTDLDTSQAMPMLSVSPRFPLAPNFGCLAALALLMSAALAGHVETASAEDAARSPAAAAAPSVDDPAHGEIFDIVGTWQGVNKTISDKKGLREWTKTIQITEQTDRRFRGYFTYSAGTKSFFGVIYPGDESFTWVASDSKGYNHGRILDDDRITACYVEPGADATAGCADLTRISRTPVPKPQADAGAR